ncbi:hypothetical protein F2Q70_00009366 [Brassica cretica]|uniref:Uncharacterized protein n=1 Tax=Brassica cretica TaxID=69181 RepID=A0A8S9LYJ9_BRACR|nr:hypothetical protein F2Q70_00009366 [Brassica cretica]
MDSWEKRRRRERIAPLKMFRFEDFCGPLISAESTNGLEEGDDDMAQELNAVEIAAAYRLLSLGVGYCCDGPDALLGQMLY